MSKKIKNEQKKFLGETLNQYDKALDEAINQLDKKNREQNHKISSLVNSFDNEYLEKDVEGNMTTLENSKDGMVIINEIQGNTEVNYCKDGEKELILNGDIDTQGKSFVTITEGVDGGLVDVSLEGNTEVNLSSTKDPVLVTREFDDINCNSGKLQYTIDDVITINDEPGKVDIDRIVGDTMVNHAVNGSEELILNAHINESGDNNIKLNGVTSEGGKVDVALEGNTLVNVSKTKDSTALPLDEELTYLNASTQYTVQFVSDKAITVDIALGGTQLLAQNIVIGLNRISITTPETLANNKLVIDGTGAKISEIVVTDTDREFKYFEGMKSVGECEDLEVVSSNSDGTLSNTQTLTHEPLRAVGDVKDKYVIIDGKWYIERNVGKYIYTGKEGWSPVDDDRTTDTARTFFVASTPQNGKSDGNLKTFKSDKLPNKMYNSSDLGIWIDIHTFITLPRNEVNTVAELKLWLQSNPIIGLYQLRTPQYEPIDYNPFEVYSDITHISNNSTIPCNMIIKNHGYNTVALKENTQYTLYVNKNTTNALTYRLGDYVEINSQSKFTFTTPSTLTDKTLRIDCKGAKVNDLMLIEGTPTNDSVGYFDGLKSSYECEQVTDENDENYGKYKVDIKVVGKNKFDGQWQKAERAYGVYYYGKGTYTISIQEKDLSLLDNSCRLGYSYLDGSNINWMYLNGEVIERNKTLTNGRLVFRMPTKEAFELFKRAFDIQIEEGSVATEYEPYFESKQTIYLNSPLLKGDEIVWKDNKIQHYHKMKTVVLDGSDDEGWINATMDVQAQMGYYRYMITYVDSYPTLQPINALNDRITQRITQIHGNYEYLYCQGSPSSLEIYIQLKNIKTVDDFKIYLQQNPVKVVYQLAEPTYEEISDYPLKLNVIANSSLSTESTIQVTNISFNVYEETLPYLYPNTKYYITFNADVDRNNIIIDLGGNHTVLDCKVGFNKVEITTPSDTTNLLTFSGTGVNIDHVKVTQQDIDEYFEGMKSVGECEELEITSANSDNSLSNAQQLIHEPLRAVGDVKDKYVLLDGKWHIERKCGEVVFDGSEDENIAYSNTYDRIIFIGINVNNTNTKVISNNGLCGIFTWNSVYRIGIKNISQEGISSLDMAKQWLQQNPITVVYELETPIYEEINYNPFEVYADTTHITTNSLIPTNVVVKNHGYNCILKPSTTYTIALNKPNCTISAKLGGSAKVDSTNSIFTITTPSILNDNVLRLSGSGNVKDIMILEGDKTVNTPSYFEGIESGFEQEYDKEKGKYRVTVRVEGNGKESSIIFYINEPLRGTSTARDKVFIQDGKVVVQRNFDSITVNGSEKIDKSSEGYDSANNITFNISMNNLLSAWLSPNDILCSTLPSVGHYIWNGVTEGITSDTQKILFGISRKRLKTQDINGFKQWLQQNPTTIVYALVKPTYEEVDCDLSKLVLENYENSSLIFESNIPVSANIRYSGEVPVVTQAKTLSSKVDNTTFDINENIIPYMCDIDYRIVELQLMNGDTQGEGIELLGIGDIEILGNENVLFNNREDKKYNYSYDMLKRDILSQRYSKEEYQYRLDRYLLANKISDEEYKELEGLLNNGE